MEKKTIYVLTSKYNQMYNNGTMPNYNQQPPLQKVSVRRSRRFWMVISQTNPVLLNERLPIYRLKKVAQAQADEYGGKVVAVDCFWTPIEV